MVSEKYRNFYRNKSHRTEDEKKIPLRLWQAAVLVGLHSFLFGYCVVSFNPCLVTGENKKGSECFDGTDSTCPPGSVYNDINLTTMEASLGSALTVAGSWFGTMVEGYPCERYGRKVSVIITSLLFICGAVLASCTDSVYTLLLGRAISGIGVGFASGIPLVLLAEIAPDTTRGTITSVHQIMLTWGIFTAGVLAYGLIIYVDHGWQYLQGLSAVPAIIVLLFANYIPESPKWLLSKHIALVKSEMTVRNRALSGPHPIPDAAEDAEEAEEALTHGGADDAHQKDMVVLSTSQSFSKKSAYMHAACDVLDQLRNPEHDIEQEIADIIEAIEEDAKICEVTWAEVFAHRDGVLIGGGLMFFQAMSGINSILSFSTTVFLLAGFKQSVIGTMLIGAVRIVMAYVEFGLINKMGRRTLLLSGTYVQFTALLILAIVLLCPIDETAQGIVAATAVLVYMCGFALGLGSVVYTVIGEVLPTRVRVKSVGAFMSMNWFISLVISFLTLTAINGLGGVKPGMSDEAEADAKKKGVAILYLIFAAFNMSALIFLHVQLPETKGWNPEDREHLVSGKSQERLECDQALPSTMALTAVEDGVAETEKVGRNDAEVEMTVVTDSYREDSQDNSGRI